MRLQRGKACRRRLEESRWSEEDVRVVDKGGGRELWLWMKGGRTSDKKTAGRTTVSTIYIYIYIYVVYALLYLYHSRAYFNGMYPYTV